MELQLLSAIGLLILIAYLCIRVFQLESKSSNNIYVSNRCDRQLLEKILKLPEGSRVNIENEIDAGLHDDESS